MEEAVRPGPGRWCHTQCWMDGNSSSQPHKTVDAPTRATLQLLMVKYNNCLVKGFLRKLTLLMVSMSNIFLRKKKNGSYRLILNLRGLNASIEYQQFKMESLTCAAQLMKKNCYMASIDLTDAYYTVPVAVEHRKYLRFLWRNRLFQYTCLPNGLASAPRNFTKLLKPVYSTLRSQGYLNVGYIDDSYLQGDSKTGCWSNILTTLNLFESLGFLINHEKSVLQPCQKLAFLGFLLDSVNMKVFLTAEKREKIILAYQQLLKKSVISIRKVAHAIGLLVSSLPAVQYGPLHYRSLEIDNKIMAIMKLLWPSPQNLSMTLVGGWLAYL